MVLKRAGPAGIGLAAAGGMGQKKNERNVATRFIGNSDTLAARAKT
jgi:hypothetical protein